MPILRLRNAHLVRSSLWQPNPTAAQIARLHSTPSLCEKWRIKWNSDVNRGQEPSKNHIRYATRQKRADAKKALKKLLYNSGSSNFSFQNYESSSNFSGRRCRSAKHDEHWNCFDKNFEPKPFSQFGGKSNSKKIKRKFKRESLFEDDEDQLNNVFEGTFGKSWYAWCFGSSNDWFHHSSSSGFEWRDHSHWKSRRAEEWNSDSDSKAEFDADSRVVGLSSDRSILGLPPRGPLKIEEVKKAFHLSALKWHPDKHQQPSQAMAEEKFKLCVNAYKSLCNALSPGH